ncbi:MAG: hypothetical protein Q4A27_01640 [bacterium]|nr:hypothetical protein [bacterium]
MKKLTFYSILSLISTAGLVIFANAPVALAAFEGGVEGGLNQARTSEMPTTLFGNAGIFTQIVSIMLFFVGVLSIIMLIFGGLRYIVSNGDSKKVEGAKNTILYAIVGLIVAILSYAIINFVLVTFTGTNGGVNSSLNGGGGNGVSPTNV